jgi:hypothetical protein
MNKIRVAHCACGQLRAQAEGEPEIVSICHCLDCQRRSGSPFGAGAFYKTERVRVSGERKTFTRTGSEGRKATNSFCPQCGGTLYWEAEGRPGVIGIAVGMFGDPGFPAPARSVYEERMHSWLAFKVELEHIF